MSWARIVQLCPVPPGLFVEDKNGSRRQGIAALALVEVGDQDDSLRSIMPVCYGHQPVDVSNGFQVIGEWSPDCMNVHVPRDLDAKYEDLAYDLDCFTDFSPVVGGPEPDRDRETP